MTIRETLIHARKILKKAKITSADLDAEVILIHTIKKPREFLYTHPEVILTTRQEKEYFQHIKLRTKCVPIAYITESKKFFGLNFKVNNNVLVPRPETELLVEETISIAKKNYKQAVVITDIGTGSGAIAIALAKNLSKAKIIATDKSTKALCIAKQNARNYQVKIKFLHGDLLAPIKNEKVDILVANLPYLDVKIKNLLRSSDTKGLKFEPKMALYSGTDGLDAYRKLINQITRLEIRPKYILLEAGPTQFKTLAKNILKLFSKAKIKIKKDLAGFDRYLVWKN